MRNKSRIKIVSLTVRLSSREDQALAEGLVRVIEPKGHDMSDQRECTHGRDERSTV